jgi:hypothetical protein
MDDDRLRVEVVRFMVRGWFVIKYRGFDVCCRANGRGRRNGEEEEGNHLLGHNLNITDGFTGGFHQRFLFVGNFACIYDMSFLIPSFFTIILSVYTERIFSSVFTDRYSKRLFCR